jgi:hypothetical protein
VRDRIALQLALFAHHRCMLHNAARPCDATCKTHAQERSLAVVDFCTHAYFNTLRSRMIAPHRRHSTARRPADAHTVSHTSNATAVASQRVRVACSNACHQPYVATRAPTVLIATCKRSQCLLALCALLPARSACGAAATLRISLGTQRPSADLN